MEKRRETSSRAKLLLLGIAFTLLAQNAMAQDGNDLFERRVRPLLLKYCLQCHGPQKAEAGLRVDSREHLLKGSDERKVVQLDQPDKSLIVQAIRRVGEVMMPPEVSLSMQEAEYVEQWIRLGMPWPSGKIAATSIKDHWAFQPIKRPHLPEVQQQDWCLMPIDRFVLARLEAHQLSPSPRITTRKLFRRASYGLLGLPPTAWDVAALDSDKQVAAWEKAVEKLLANPAYGERWGRHWLDVARYADNKGYVFFEEKNYPWAYTYRDYVIESFNKDLPYDQFIREQLAADLLYGNEPDPRLRALGYLTTGPRFMNNFHDMIDDRIDVVTRGMMGLTVTCARCHDHKFDPIPQADYYSLYGVFRSSREPLVPPSIRPATNSKQDKAFEAELKKRLAAFEAFTSRIRRQIITDGKQRLDQYLLAAHQQSKKPSTENFMLLTEHGGLNPKVILRWKFHLEQAAKYDSAIWLPWLQLADVADDAFSRALKRLVTSSAKKIHPVVLEALVWQHPTSAKELAKVYSLLLQDVDRRWTKATAADAKRLALDQPHFESLRQELYGRGAPLNLPDNLDWGFLDLIPDRKNQGEFRKFLQAVEAWCKTGPGAPPRSMVLVDKKDAFEPSILIRGNPNRIGKRVKRQFISAFGKQEPYQRGSGRLELAEDIVAADNPLTARVLANRIWMHHFGRALVATPSDFGLRSEPPSHPQLLDYLAWRLQSSGWSIKSLHREILCSQVYAQMSRNEGPNLKRDPDNRFLWRMNVRRLEFEPLRDSLLAVSGRLNPTLGGKPGPLLGDVASPQRRSVYAFIDRMDLSQTMRMFDFPSPQSSSPGRATTTIPPQALFMMNHPFPAKCASVIAEQMNDSNLTTTEKLKTLYEQLFQRAPSDYEKQVAVEFFGRTKNSSSKVESRWSYGYGTWKDKNLQQFRKLPYWNGSRWQTGEKLPDPQLGWLFMDAKGGHPSMKHSIVRRWIAPHAGTVSLQGLIQHQPKEGNGIQCHLTHNDAILGSWKVHHRKQPLPEMKLTVSKGDVVDLVVEPLGNITHDEHLWRLSIHYPGTPTVFDSEADFRGPTTSRWQQFVHALLMTNEFTFIE